MSSNIIYGVNVADIHISILGVVLALAISIFLIIRKMNPALAMFTGVFVGALAGGANLHQVMDIVVLGGRQVVGVNIRIIAGGFLAGVLIETGSAETIARAIVKGLGERLAILAIALSAAIVVGVGVFIPVGMLIVAPIALSVAYKSNISKYAAILAISGGGKAGNIVSPNANTFAAANAFDLPLSEVMIGGAIPGLVALTVTVILCTLVKRKNFQVVAEDIEGADDSSTLPSLGKASVAPAIVIGLLILNPIGDILGIGAISSATLPMDPFYVLPIGSVIGLLVMGKGRQIAEIAQKGAIRMAPVVLMLFGAGAIGGLITTSAFPSMMENTLYQLGIPVAFLAPLSSTIFSSAAGSHSAGVIVGGGAFAETILHAGVPAMAGAVMLHTGGGFIDTMPHNNIFLASQQGMKCTMAERIKVVPLEAIVGGMMTLTSVVLYMIGFWS
ncbi:MAG: GntP family permease [Oscillospiraceae bacterium]|nr:GntP family permease [Oscillospiraceae bacterium]